MNLILDFLLITACISGFYMGLSFLADTVIPWLNGRNYPNDC